MTNDDLTIEFCKKHEPLAYQKSHLSLTLVTGIDIVQN